MFGLGRKEFIMLKTKNIFDKAISYKETNSGKINKASLLKRIALGVSLSIAAIASWDVAVNLTNIKHVADMVDYKAHNNAQINNYSTFKSKMEAVPYSEADFNRDLSIFKATYIDGNETFRKAISYGDGLDAILLLKYTYTDPVAYLKEMSFVNQESVDNLNGDNLRSTLNSEKIQRITDKYKINGPSYSEDLQTSKLVKSLFVVMNSDLNIAANNTYAPIYGNFERLLNEHEINKNIYLWTSAFIKVKLGKISTSEYQAEQDKINGDVATNIETLKTYYKNGDMDKLKEVFRLGNAFTSVVVDQSLKENAHIGEPLSALVMSYLDKNYNYRQNIAESAKTYQKLSGSLNPEKESLYDKDDFFLWH